jgi:Hint domain
MFMQDFSRTTTAFYPVETLLAPVTTGLVAGTLLETSTGWRAVETLTAGDCVQTLDGGLARILRLDRRSLPTSQDAPLLILQGGCYDACSDLLLLPGQHLLIDTLDDEISMGAPFALLPALALCGPQMRRHRPAAALEIITPLFADEEIIYANSGVLMHCPGIADGAGRYPEDSFFPRLDITTARDFLARRMQRLAA